jgi:hypothetical protein
VMMAFVVGENWTEEQKKGQNQRQISHWITPLMQVYSQGGGQVKMQGFVPGGEKRVGKRENAGYCNRKRSLIKRCRRGR